MVRKYRKDSNGYLIMVGTGNGGTEITEQEYSEILDVLKTKPQGTETTDYRLKSDLTWEAYTIEPVEPQPTAEEIVNILTGESE